MLPQWNIPVNKFSLPQRIKGCRFMHLFYHIFPVYYYVITVTNNIFKKIMISFLIYLFYSSSHELLECMKRQPLAFDYPLNLPVCQLLSPGLLSIDASVSVSYCCCMHFYWCLPNEIFLQSKLFLHLLTD